MGWGEFVVIFGCIVAAILAFRCVPAFALRSRELSAGTGELLGLIPVAAFAALVSNDLLSPQMFDEGVAQGLVPILAAVVVALVARRFRSLVASALAGVVAYAILALVL